jgi:hypothetical protein
MDQHFPVTPPEWRGFLDGYSDDYLRQAGEEEMARLTEGQRESRWLGYEPAGEKAVAAVEERLGVRLPPSYRGFLFTSNGWRDIDPELDELLTVEELGWFADIEAELLGWWSDAGHDDLVAKVGRCLLVSGPTDCAVYWLLDPKEIGPDGEWAAYEWATGDGSAPVPYPSFGALVVSARQVFSRWKTDGVIAK